RRPWLRKAAIAATVVVLAGAIFFWVSRRPSAPREDSSRLWYTQAMSLMTPASGAPELLAADQALAAHLAREPGYLPATRAQIEVRIRLYEATTDPQWLAKARQTLRSPAAAGLTGRTLLQARIDLLAGSFSEVIRNLQGNPALLNSSPDANRFLGRALEAS